MQQSETAPASAFGAAAFEVPGVEKAPTIRVERSAYDGLLTTIAARSQAAARLVRENQAVSDAMRRTARWVLEYLAKHQLAPHQINITGSMTPEGAIVLQIGRR